MYIRKSITVQYPQHEGRPILTEKQCITVGPNLLRYGIGYLIIPMHCNLLVPDECSREQCSTRYVVDFA